MFITSSHSCPQPMLGLDPKRGSLTLSGKSFHVSEALQISVKNRQKHAAFEFVQKSRVSNWKKYWFSLGATLWFRSSSVLQTGSEHWCLWMMNKDGLCIGPRQFFFMQLHVACICVSLGPPKCVESMNIMPRQWFLQLNGRGTLLAMAKLTLNHDL